MSDINKAIERLRQDCHPTKPSPYSVVDCGVQRIADILAVCDCAEKAMRVVEAARRAVGQCCNHAGLEQALAAMEEQ